MAWPIFCFLVDNLLERKDMDVNEHERLFNITLRHKLNKGSRLLLLFYISLSQYVVFNNEYSSFPKVSEK
jgi:hypothetical protein